MSASAYNEALVCFLMLVEASRVLSTLRMLGQLYIFLSKQFEVSNADI